MKKVRFLGLDVYAETITVAIAEPDGEVRSLGTIPNGEESVRKLVKKLGPAEQLQACYEAGPKLSSGRSHGGLGAGRGSRSSARSGTSPRIGQAGSVTRASSLKQVFVAPGPTGAPWGPTVDDKVHAMGPGASAIRTTRPRLHPVGLPARGRACQRPGATVGGGDRRGGEAGAGDDEGSHSSAAGAPWHRSDFGGHDRE